MAAVVVSRERPPLVEHVEDSVGCWCGGFELWPAAPKCDLVLRLGRVEVEEADQCAFGDVANIAYLWLARLVWLGVPEGVSEVKHRQAGRVDTVRSARRRMASEHDSG